MSERIKELEAQCWEARQYGPPWFDAKKFAELIVRECAEFVENEIEVAGYKVKRILKHFGVEE